MYSYIQNHCQLRERCVVSRRVALATYCYGYFIHLGNAREKVIWNVLLLTNYCSKCMELVQIVERDLCFASAFRWYALPFGFRISLFLTFERVCVYAFYRIAFLLFAVKCSTVASQLNAQMLYLSMDFIVGNRIFSAQNVHITQHSLLYYHATAMYQRTFFCGYLFICVHFFSCSFNNLDSLMIITFSF